MIDIDYLYHESCEVGELETPKTNRKHVIRNEVAHEGVVQQRNCTMYNWKYVIEILKFCLIHFLNFILIEKLFSIILYSDKQDEYLKSQLVAK